MKDVFKHDTLEYQALGTFEELPDSMRMAAALLIIVGRRKTAISKLKFGPLVLDDLSKRSLEIIKKYEWPVSHFIEIIEDQLECDIFCDFKTDFVGPDGVRYTMKESARLEMEKSTSEIKKESLLKRMEKEERLSVEMEKLNGTEKG
jgi:hypothetical protein